MCSCRACCIVTLTDNLPEGRWQRSAVTSALPSLVFIHRSLSSCSIGWRTWWLEVPALPHWSRPYLPARPHRQTSHSKLCALSLTVPLSHGPAHGGGFPSHTGVMCPHPPFLRSPSPHSSSQDAHGAAGVGDLPSGPRPERRRLLLPPLLLDPDQPVARAAAAATHAAGECVYQLRHTTSFLSVHL